jgi:hypothetical protein
MNVPEQEETNRLNPLPEEKKQEDNNINQQQYNENEIKKEEEKKADIDPSENKVENNPLKPPIVNYRDTKLQNEFKNIFGTDLSVDSETNNNRRKIMHISVFAIMIELVILQVLWYLYITLAYT